MGKLKKYKVLHSVTGERSECHGHRANAGFFWECHRDALLVASNAEIILWIPFPSHQATLKSRLAKN